jgi:hypothetical protein
MKVVYCLLIAIILAIMPGADAITMSISEGTGGQSFSSTASLQADDSDVASFSAVLDGDSISHIFSGSGNMNESHSVTNSQGFSAEVATKLIGADRYDYSYTLTPNSLDYVRATQSLNVGDATYIHARSKASNSKENEAYASMKVREGGINGYTSTAYADDKAATTSQEANSIDYAAFAEASTGATHWVEMEQLPMLDEYHGAYADMKLREGGLCWYSSSSSIDGSSAKADQSFSSDYSKYIESYTGAFNLHLNEDSHRYNSSGAYASTTAYEGDIYLSADSSTDINRTEVSQYANANYAKNIRSSIVSRSEFGTYSMGDSGMNAEFIISGAGANAESNEGGLSMWGEAKASDNGAEAYRWLYSDYARHISSSTYAYDGNGSMQCNNDSFCCSRYNSNNYSSTNMEITDGYDVGLRGDAHSNTSSISALESNGCCGGIKNAKVINIKTSAHYLDDLGNWTSIDREACITNGGLTSLNAHSQIDDHGPEVGIEHGNA